MSSDSSKASPVGGDSPAAADTKNAKESFGGKTITFAGSFCLQLNNSMGPAMVLLPLMNQAAGWLTPTITLVLLFFLSTLAGTMLCEAMQRIPGNRNFNAEPRYEFATTVRHYYGKTAYCIFQIAYNISLQALNIAAMIVSAQTVDIFIYKMSHHGYALDYKTFTIANGCEDFMIKNVTNVEECFVQGNIFSHDQVISLGFIITMIMCIPLGYINLDANMWFQWFSLIGLLVFTCEFIVQFILNAIPGTKWHQNGQTASGFDQTPLFDLRGQPQVLGLSVLAYAYIVTIPSWVNEKKQGVNVNKAIWYPAIAALIMKVSVGITGSWGFHLFNAQNGTAIEGSDDILNFLLAPQMPWWTQYSAYLWDLTTLIPGIPVLSIMVRYNLQAGNVCGRKMAFFLGVVLPWIVTAFCYEYDALNTICSWAGNVISGFVNFTVPAILYYSSHKRYAFLDGLKEKPKEVKPLQQENAEPSQSDTKPLLSLSASLPLLQAKEYTTVSASETEITSENSLLNINEDYSLTSCPIEKELPFLNEDIEYLEPPVNAVPEWIPIDRKKLALFIAAIFTFLSVAYTVVQIYATVVGDQD
ncbi:uncharacterized protein LOC134183270 [Corticium candelabrum]|uniref:uncharacterized protein LOC134183270 n=1 Tax=Corticium candelabrum TaxID=121492 RepID=UPI002E26E771|nr:uncharacterized protein LOC134183270 [Corticium candelabrum]